MGKKRTSNAPWNIKLRRKHKAPDVQNVWKVSCSGKLNLSEKSTERRCSKGCRSPPFGKLKLNNPNFWIASFQPEKSGQPKKQ